MSEFPRLGMTFEQVRGKLKKYESIKKKGNNNLYTSLLRQAGLHEGHGAVKELHAEHESALSQDVNNHSTNRLGYSPRYSDRFNSISW